MSAVTRRSALATGLVLAAGTACGAVPAARAADERVRLTLPEPSVRQPIGTTSLHLVDHSRRDPWTSTPRELMVSLWYPAEDTTGHPRAPWLPAASAALYRQKTAQNLRTSLDNVDFPLTHAYLDAPVRAGLGRPVVLFSPAYGAVRAFGTALVEELAARGYMVVTIDHTHEAAMVEFPGGRLEPSLQPAEPTDRDLAEALRIRQGDVEFVLDELANLNSGTNPDAGHRPLPGSLDLSRTGMYGHSLGGNTAASAMTRDRRILAGVDLDGSVIGRVARTGLDRPFMLMGNATHGRDTDPSWGLFWSNLRGWRRDLLLRDSGHQTFTDLAPLTQQLEKALPIPEDVVANLTTAIGTIDADRAVTAVRAYLTAFFDLHLRHHDDGLLSGPSARYPEIRFVP
jgi:dienelactone hydrolase